MLVFGIGEVLGSFFIGQVIDSQGSRLVCLVNVVVVVVMTFVTLAFLGIN